MKDLPVPAEIIILDDASKVDFSSLNEKKNIRFLRSSVNQGRAATRESLAEWAKYPFLLFLDADVMPTSKSFLLNYLKASNQNKILVGGLVYQNNKPEQNLFFRWYYGKMREEIPLDERIKNKYSHFMTGNFWIPKNVFLRFPLKGIHSGYGHEDTLLGLKFQQENMPLQHIENPVCHLGLDENELFWKKSQEAVVSLWKLRNLGFKLPTKLNSVYNVLERVKLNSIVSFLFKYMDNQSIKNYIFSGKYLSLYLFDLYRLAYYGHLSVIEKKI